MAHSIKKIKKVAMKGDRKYNNHAAAVIVKGKIVCIKRNMSNRNTSNILSSLVWPDKILCLNHHAEMNVIHTYASIYYRKVCISKIKKILTKQKITIIVARFNRQGNMKNSMPCGTCRKLMISCGIKKVIFSGDKGELIEMKPCNLPIKYESTGTRYVQSVLSNV